MSIDSNLIMILTVDDHPPSDLTAELLLHAKDT